MDRFVEVSSTNWILSDFSMLILKSLLIYVIWVCLMTRMYFHKRCGCSPALLKKWSFSYSSLSNKKSKKMWSFKTHTFKKKTTTNTNTPNPFLKQSQLSPASIKFPTPYYYRGNQLPRSSNQLAATDPREKPNSASHWSLPYLPPPWWSNLNFKKSLLAPLSSKDSKTYRGGELWGSLVVVLKVPFFWAWEQAGVSFNKSDHVLTSVKSTDPKNKCNTYFQ